MTQISIAAHANPCFNGGSVLNSNYYTNMKIKSVSDKSFWSRLDRVERLRFNSENRAQARLERLERAAAPLIGELASGKYYAYPIGGKYFESHSYSEVVQYLARNKHIRA